MEECRNPYLGSLTVLPVRNRFARSLPISSLTVTHLLHSATRLQCFSRQLFTFGNQLDHWLDNLLYKVIVFDSF
jgi:hypothetical protein